MRGPVLAVNRSMSGRERVQAAEISVQREHLGTVNTVRVIAASLLTDFQQCLDSTFQVRPFAAHQAQDGAVGGRLVLMQPETNGAEAVVVLEQRFQFIELPGFEVIQSLPVIGLSQKISAEADRATATYSSPSSSRRCNVFGLPRSARIASS